MAAEKTTASRRDKSTEPRAYRLCVRLSDAERAQLDEWAQGAGMSRGAFLWAAAREKAARLKALRNLRATPRKLDTEGGGL